MTYIIDRLDSVIGGYIVVSGDIFSAKVFEPVFEALRLDAQDHKSHDVRYIFHPQGSQGVASPLNMNATMGWKCRECTHKQPRLAGWSPDGNTWYASEPGTFTSQESANEQK